MSVQMRFADVGGINRFHKATKALSDRQMRTALSRAVNHTGGVTRTQVREKLARQTGLKLKTIRKAVRSNKSNAGTLTYTMKSFGGDISLKYFSAKETRRGVTAKPFGKKTQFAGHFIKAGRFPLARRVLPRKLNGHVFEPTGTSTRWGRSIELRKSGVVIPEQMVTGKTADAFAQTSAQRLPDRVAYEVRQLTGGVVT